MVCYQTNCVRLQIPLSTFPISQTKMVFTIPFLACLQLPGSCTCCASRAFANHQRSRSQPFCSASGVGVTGFCPRTRPGVQQAALEDTRCRHQHLLRQVSRVTYDSYVVLLYRYRFLLTNHNLLLSACQPTSNN